MRRALAAVPYFEQLSGALAAVEASDSRGVRIDVGDAIERTINLILAAARRRATLMFIGNGGSAAIASHQSLDFWRTAGIRAVAFNDPVLLTCISNDFGYASVFEKPINMFGRRGDVLVAISSSGRSANILGGVAEARDKRCSIVTMSGFDGDNPLRRLGDVNFYVPSDSYGLVEIAHLTLSHCVLDAIKLKSRRRTAGRS